MLTTKSLFYYGFVVTASNLSLDFDDGSGEINASIDIGSYSFTELGDQIALTMNDQGNQEYTVTANRDRTYTISAPGNFDLLVTTGQNAAISIWSLIGFTVDQTGANSYTSGLAGFEYRPQFKLQKYTPSENFRRKIESKVNQSATGIVEVVSFGSVNYTEFEITNITNYAQSLSSLLDNDTSAVTNARSFLEAITDKQRIEFMPDRDTPSVYETLLLESTPESKEGVDFRLKEMLNKKMANWYETGRLLFRKVD